MNCIQHAFFRNFFIMSGSFWLCLSQHDNIRATLVADHSRKTFRQQDEEALNLIYAYSPKMNDVLDEPLHSFTSMFTQSREQQVDGEESNIFKKLWFDPSYKIHNVCDPDRSGSQVNELSWSEPGDLLLKIIGNGVIKNGYNMFMAPGQSRGLRTDVHVAVFIESMSSFKAQTMDFEVDMYLAMGWFDRRLAHNCTYPILVTQKLIADRIWHPDLYFVNSKFAYLQEVTTPNLMVIVYPDGLIFKSLRIDVTLSCSMDLKRFPMDKQECPIIIQSYAYIEQIVNLTWHVDPPNFPIGSNAEIKLNDMIITKKRYEKCAGPYPMFRGTADWSCVCAYIVMRRLVLFHIIQTYIPTGMLVSISWMSFWLDPRASPARISLTITSLLTLTTMSNGARQDLPQVSYIKALDVWLTFSQALIFLVLLEYSFVSFYMTKRTFECAHRRTISTTMLRSFTKQPSSQSNPIFYNVITFTIEDDRPMAMTTWQKINIVARAEFLQRWLTTKQESEAPTLNIPRCMNTTNGKSNIPDSSFTLIRGLSNSASALLSTTPRAATHLYNKFDFTRPCQRCATKDEQTARAIDQYSRLLFPLVFLIFCLCYWLYYSLTDS